MLYMIPLSSPTDSVKALKPQCKMIVVVVDVNECNSLNGGCAQTCSNSAGSYRCSCRAGYTLASNSRDCNGQSSNSSHY